MDSKSTPPIPRLMVGVSYSHLKRHFPEPQLSELIARGKQNGLIEAQTLPWGKDKTTCDYGFHLNSHGTQMDIMFMMCAEIAMHRRNFMNLFEGVSPHVFATQHFFTE